MLYQKAVAALPNEASNSLLFQGANQVEGDEKACSIV